ncbi:hypothetical protein ACHAXR_010757 [Thalassiosira sp. AJA248-18]
MPEKIACTWSPQDLTRDNPGFLPIPDDDYIKKYQNNPQLWPVEFFIIAYRRVENEETQQIETQILVRKSANGTSKYGVGTGVPLTRWVLSAQTKPPTGYKFSEPIITFDAGNYPEFPNNGEDSWTYTKIDIREDAFTGSDELDDPELKNYASKIRDELRAALSNKIEDEDELSPWQRSTNNVVAMKIADNPNSVTAAIQGTLRMSGLFAKKEEAADDGLFCHQRFVSFEDAPNPANLVQSSRIYTMFPQMPCPMPLPSTSPEELQQEIASRETRMSESGRNPHKDKHGRIFTHKSTSNVSNTIHGVYFTFDATNLSGLDKVPALDLFGTKKIEREWVSLIDLNVLEEDGRTIDSIDTKPTFISGFIVRQLVKEGAFEVQ